MTSSLPRQQSFEWVTYQYRHLTKEAQAEFEAWIVMNDWSDVYAAVGSDQKASAYQRHIDRAMDTFFPLRTVKKKSTDPPWLNRATKKKIRRRNEIYMKEGESELWRWMKKTIDDIIRDRKKGYMEEKKKQLTSEDANRSFFRLVKAFNTPEKPQTFDVRSLCPGMSDPQVANNLADFFNRISEEFDPLSPDQIPVAHWRRLEPLSPHEVSARIKRFRKPKSMVAGDVFPDLMTRFCDFFAMPLTDLFNEIASSGIWPSIWKTEYVTVIPMKSCPETFGDLRNISCTMLVSKIMESYVALKFNQYGGTRGCSGGHMIIKVWQKILSNLEDRRAATVLTSIDYAKAFNRLSFQHCLAAFARQGASRPILQLLASFLSGRTMRVRVGSDWSTPRQVTGGCPQGSILGVLLFNLTTDDLEEGSDFVSSVYRPFRAGGLVRKRMTRKTSTAQLQMRRPGAGLARSQTKKLSTRLAPPCPPTTTSSSQAPDPTL